MPPNDEPRFINAKFGIAVVEDQLIVGRHLLETACFGGRFGLANYRQLQRAISVALLLGSRHAG